MDLVNLDDSMFIGKGAFKAAYRDPRDEKRCIKVLITDKTLDIDREINYRNIRDRRGKTSKILTRYYGTVNTNKGIGYVFEYIMDYNGKLSQPIDKFFENIRKEKKWTELEFTVYKNTILERFYTEFVNEVVIVTGVECCNFLVQRNSDDEYDVSLRIIDNIVIRTLIPLVGYVDYFGKKYCKKYWKRLLAELKEDMII